MICFINIIKNSNEDLSCILDIFRDKIFIIKAWLVLNLSNYCLMAFLWKINYESDSSI